MVTYAPAPAFAPSDIVKYRNNGQYIELSITSHLGFNKYNLMSIENGTQEVASAFEMEKIGRNNSDTDEEISETTENQEETRFKHLNKEEIDELAKKRTEPTTEKQTIWAIKIFKGKKTIKKSQIEFVNKPSVRH